MSETEPQVAAGARLGPSSGGEWVPTNPPGPRSPASARSVPRSAGGHGGWGQRCSGTWRDGEQGLGRGAAGRAPLPPPGDNQGSTERDIDPCPNAPSPGLEQL